MRPQFHETGMGKKFIQVDVPALIKAVNRVADAAERIAIVLETGKAKKESEV